MILQMPTLVLNKGWQAIDATTVIGAFGKMFAERANAICPRTYTPYPVDEWINLPVEDGDLYVKTATSKVRAPEVIVSTEYNQYPKRVVAFNRRNLWRRDNYRCQYCGCEPRMDDIEMEHILPVTAGGLSNFENCVLACTTCNRKKGGRTPEQAGMFLLKRHPDGIWRPTHGHRPKVPMWSPIFASSKKVLPKSWNAFLKDKRDELYWNVDLE